MGWLCHPSDKRLHFDSVKSEEADKQELCMRITGRGRASECLCQASLLSESCLGLWLLYCSSLKFDFKSFLQLFTDGLECAAFVLSMMRTRTNKARLVGLPPSEAQGSLYQGKMVSHGLHETAFFFFKRHWWCEIAKFSRTRQWNLKWPGPQPDPQGSPFSSFCPLHPETVTCFHGVIPPAENTHFQTLFPEA